MQEYSIETEDKKINKAFYINQVYKNYKLTIESNSDNITLNISEINKIMQTYKIKLNLEQIKEKHDTFSNINNCQEFFDIIKDNIEKKGIFIKKQSENLIRFEFKKNSIIFELTKENIDLNKLVENINIMNDKYNIKISDLENKLIRTFNENKYMKNEIDELKKTNKILFNNIIKLKEKINNIHKSNNNKNQDLNERFIEKEKMEKNEEIKRNDEILKLIKDIQEIKKMLYDLKNKKINLRLESLEKNINQFIINKNEKESQKNCLENLNKNIYNIYAKEKENSKINEIKQCQENSKNKESEQNKQSNLKQKYKLLKLKNKYYSNNYKTNISLTPEKSLNKFQHKTNLDNFGVFNDKNKMKNIFPPIKMSKEKQNQIINTQKDFYIKKENLINKEKQENRNEIMRHTFSENKILFPKEENKIYKKQVLLSKKNSKNKKINIEKVKLKMDEGEEIKNLPRITIFERNFDNKNEEEKKNSPFQFSRTATDSKKKDFDFCYLS